MITELQTGVRKNPQEFTGLYLMSCFSSTYIQHSDVSQSRLENPKTQIRHAQVTDVSQTHLSDDWEVTYENVRRPVAQEEHVTSSFKRDVQNFFAALAKYSTVFLLLVCLLLLAATIGLAVHLSRVSEQHDSSTAKLQQLQEEHDALDYSLTSDIQMKQATLQEIQQTLRKTTEEHERTKSLLSSTEGELYRKEQSLEKTAKEKANLEDKLQRNENDLKDANKQLTEKNTQLYSCESDRKNLNLAKQRSDKDLRSTKSSLSDTNTQLKATKDNLTKKDTELSDTKKKLSQTQLELKESKRLSGLCDQDRSAMSLRLRNAQKCLSLHCKYQQDYAVLEAPKAAHRSSMGVLE
ncbi:centromere protein F [Bombina bombina]|uniref:centromere protein F n=1 Tax=Bombina bombina TaxID=8345 RepID=UPI00235A84E4|nr:centromere protein F [Bombina bombina]